MSSPKHKKPKTKNQKGYTTMNTPIQIINAARALAGRSSISLNTGSVKIVVIECYYRNIRENALRVLKPHFAIKIKTTEQPSDMLRDLGNGRYVSNHENVSEWTDDFKNKMIQLLSKVI